MKSKITAPLSDRAAVLLRGAASPVGLMRARARDRAPHRSVGVSVADAADCERYLQGPEQLTATERAVFDLYVAGHSTKEIMGALNIKENTLKFRNKNLYGRPGVSSGKQLIAIYKMLKHGNRI